MAGRGWRQIRWGNSAAPSSSTDAYVPPAGLSLVATAPSTAGASDSASASAKAPTPPAETNPPAPTPRASNATSNTRRVEVLSKRYGSDRSARKSPYARGTNARRGAAPSTPSSSAAGAPDADVALSVCGNQGQWHRICDWTQSATPGLNQPKSQVALIQGPPGVGKTFGVGLIAGRLRREIIEVSCVDVTNPSELERDIRDACRRSEPTVVLLDDVDALDPVCHAAVVGFVTSPPSAMWPVICTAARMLPKGLRPLVSMTAHFPLSRIEARELCRHATEHAIPGRRWELTSAGSGHPAASATAAGPHPWAALLAHRGIRVRDRVRAGLDSLNRSGLEPPQPLAGMRVAMGTGDTFAALPPWPRVSEVKLHALAHSARGDLRQMEFAMTIPEASGNLLQADTPLDATAQLVYGDGDLGTALRLHAGFDPWFMANMLQANSLHGIQNEAKPSADVVAASAERRSAADAMRPTPVHPSMVEAHALAARCAAASGRKLPQPTVARIHWPRPHECGGPSAVFAWEGRSRTLKIPTPEEADVLVGARLGTAWRRVLDADAAPLSRASDARLQTGTREELAETLSAARVQITAVQWRRWQMGAQLDRLSKAKKQAYLSLDDGTHFRPEWDDFDVRRATSVVRGRAYEVPSCLF